MNKKRILPPVSDRFAPALRGLLFLTGFIALILAGTVLKFAQSVFLPLIFAWILSQVMMPMVRFMQRHKIPHFLTITLCVVLLMFSLYWIGMFISGRAAAFALQIPAYQLKLTQIMKDVVIRLSEHFTSISVADINQQISIHLSRLTGQLMQIFSGLAGIITGLISNIVMIVIMMAFILSGQKYSARKINNAFSTENASRFSVIIGSISTNLSHYLIMQTLISLITGILVWITCSLLGIANASTWGMLAFLLNYIPTIGSILAGIPPVILALVQFYPNIWPAVGAAVGILLINQGLGNIVTPKVMGDKLDLSPVVILLSLLFWGWLWGITGAFLSVIIAASIKIICEQIAPLHPIAVFMSSGKMLKD